MTFAGIEGDGFGLRRRRASSAVNLKSRGQDGKEATGGMQRQKNC